MAKVQISWRDNSDNEDKFKVYKGTASPVSTSDTLIAEVSLSGGQWNVSGVADNVTLSSINTTESSATGETFIISYDESAAGTYFYGVAASNAVGDSLVVTSSGSVEVIS